MSDSLKTARPATRKRRSIYLYFFCALALYIYLQPSAEPYRSPDQLTFDRWITGIEKIYALPPAKGGKNAEERLKTVSILLSGNSPQGSLAWKLDGEEKPPTTEEFIPSTEKLDQQAKVLRILSLMREANLLTPSEGENYTSDNARILITIKTDERQYNAELSEGIIAKNLQAQLMLRLLKEYSTETDTKLVEKSDANAG